MILRINESDISAVLLADGWHEVEPGTPMLTVVEYEWDRRDEDVRSRVLEDDAAGLSFLALSFAEADDEYPHLAPRTTTVPLSSVLAVRHTSEVDPVQKIEEPGA